MENVSALRKNLKEIVRGTQGINYKKISLKAGLGETAVRDIVEGRSKDPKHGTLQKIVDALGDHGVHTTVHDLYSEHGDTSSEKDMVIKGLRDAQKYFKDDPFMSPLLQSGLNYAEGKVKGKKE